MKERGRVIKTEKVWNRHNPETERVEKKRRSEERWSRRKKKERERERDRERQRTKERGKKRK